MKSYERTLTLEEKDVVEPAKSSNEIRKFKVFPVNMKASNYYDLANWKMTEGIHEPPWTIKYSNAVQIENPSHNPIPHAPFHTQSVERHAKLVSEVSSRVSGFKKKGIMKWQTL